jgi:hypothetical protein
MATREGKIETALVLRVSVAGQPVELAGQRITTADGQQGWEFSGLAHWKGGLDLKRLIRKLCGGRAAIPDNIIPPVRLEVVFLGYRPDPVSFSFLCKTNLFEAMFAYFKEKDKAAGYVVGLEVSEPISLSALAQVAIIGGYLDKFSIENLRVSYASESLGQRDILRPASWEIRGGQKVKLAIDSEKKSLGNIVKGFSLSARIGSEAYRKEIVLQLSGNESEDKKKKAGGFQGAFGESEKASEESPNPGAEPPAKSPEMAEVVRKWFDVQKILGPVHIWRIGGEWRRGKLGLLLDGAVDLAGLTVGLLGFRVSFPLLDFIQKPEWETLRKIEAGLDGLQIGFKGGPVQISGTLLQVPVPGKGVSVQYDGSLIVQAKVFTLTALGSFAVVQRKASLFVFAVLHKELGGPAFFFVTGLAFGFGFNRTLRLPAIAEVQSFPLVMGAVNPAYFSGGADPRAALEKLDSYIAPSSGDYWVAAGVKFSTFGLINSFALISLSFGTQLQIGLLGLSRITVPPETPGTQNRNPIACAELALKVTFAPASGVLAAEARLTDNSYLFSTKCRLTGGFAFYCWFGPQHEGDFVITLGGYHPRFVPPPHYPAVPRLGIRWAVSSKLSVLGEAYFALTPSCVMAGGKLQVLFQWGDLRAWFCAYADFLIGWKPFYYDIEIGVRIGVSYRFSFLGIRKALTLEIGAVLSLWGPPFGGKARVSLWIISFTISFGQRKTPEVPRLTWEEFHRSFLPSSEEPGDPLVSIIRITGGVIREKEVERGEGKKAKLTVVNGHEFSLSTESLIPSTMSDGWTPSSPEALEIGLFLNGEPVERDQWKERPLGIRPMGKEKLTSSHRLTFTRVARGGKSGTDHDQDLFAYLTGTLIKKNVPYALWSNNLARLNRPSAETISGVPCGLRVSLRRREPSHGLAAIDLKKFQYEDIPKTIGWKEFELPGLIPAPGEKTLMNTIWNDAVRGKRDGILRALREAKEDGSQLPEIMVSDLAARAREMFQSEPEMAVLGQPFRQPIS